MKLLNLLPFINNCKSKPKKGKDSFMAKLLKEDTNVSMMNFFLLAVLGVGVILLFVPVIGMLVDIWFNHTITIDLTGLSTYVAAVAGIFAAGGLSSAWTEFSYSKFNVPVITEEDMARSQEAADAIENAGNDMEEFIRE